MRKESQKRNEYRILVGKPESGDRLEDIGTEWSTI